MPRRIWIGQGRGRPVVKPFSLGPLPGLWPETTPPRTGALPPCSPAVGALRGRRPGSPAPPARTTFPALGAILANLGPCRRPCPQPPNGQALLLRTLALASLWPACPWWRSAPLLGNTGLLPPSGVFRPLAWQVQRPVYERRTLFGGIA